MQRTQGCRFSVGPVVALLVVVCAPPAAVGAQTPPSPPVPTNEDCQACHADPSVTRTNGTPVAVSDAVFGKSMHAGLACVDCHVDLAKVTEWPHPETLQRATCASCHDENIKSYELSVHRETQGRAAGRGARCADCHGSHDILSSKDPASRTFPLNLPTTCATCHSPSHLAGPAGAVAADYGDSVHGRAVARSGLLVSANCSSCHGSHEIRRKLDPASPVHRTNIAATCGTCHGGILPVFAASIHGQQMAKGNTAAAVCSDCHTSHTIQRAATERWQLAVIDECGTCHVDRIATYRDTYHGKVTELGFTRVAQCSSCHSSHAIQPASNPVSTVHPGNLVTTCRQCHTQANANFVQYDPHADKHDVNRNRTLYWANRFMQGLLLGIFVFFGAHTLLWFPRSYRARRQGAGATEVTAAPPTDSASAPARTPTPPDSSDANREGPPRG